MKTKEIQFDGKKYICRIVESIDGEELLIGSTELLELCNRAASGMRMMALLTRRRKPSMTRCSTSRSRRIFSCLTRN